MSQLKTKKASAGSSSASATCTPTASTAPSAGGCSKDGVPSHNGNEAGVAPSANVPPVSSLAETSEEPGTNATPAAPENQRILSASQQLQHCSSSSSSNNTSAERRTFDLNNDADPEKS